MMACAHRRVLAALVVVTACACAGMYTRVPLPSVTRSDERMAEAQAGALTVEETERLMHENFYRILYDETGASNSESRDAFVVRMMTTEAVSPTWLVTIPPAQLVNLSQRLTPLDSYRLSEAIARSQAPLRKRLTRVGSRVALSAGRGDVSFILDATQGINAGAVAGFSSRQIAVGPQVILLAGTEDGLAGILGHEVAHITHGHTRALAIQTLLVGTLQIASMAAVAVANAANCQQGGQCMRGSELTQSMAATSTVTGVVANGVITATGFSRDEEREADYYGLQYAMRAGYRGGDVALFWQHMLAWERGAGASFEIPFLRDHPATAERVVRIEKWTAGSSALVATSAGETPQPAASPTPQPDGREAGPAGGGPSAVASLNDAHPCWQTIAGDGGTCTTCCEPGGCHTDCRQGVSHAGQAGTPRPKACWNADSSVGGARAVCTTCCTASVSCSTKCSKIN
jgi:predicted Zn-dependent protease